MTDKNTVDTATYFTGKLINSVNSQTALLCTGVISGVMLEMEVGISKRVWQRAWRYPAYLWPLRWVYAIKKTPEVGIRRIPAYTPQYTTGCNDRRVRWGTAQFDLPNNTFIHIWNEPSTFTLRPQSIAKLQCAQSESSKACVWAVWILNGFWKHAD